MVLIGSTAETDGLRRPMLIAASLATIAWAVAFKGRRRIASAFRTQPNVP